VGKVNVMINIEYNSTQNDKIIIVNLSIILRLPVENNYFCKIFFAKNECKQQRTRNKKINICKNLFYNA